MSGYVPEIHPVSEVCAIRKDRSQTGRFDTGGKADDSVCGRQSTAGLRTTFYNKMLSLVHIISATPAFSILL